VRIFSSWGIKGLLVLSLGCFSLPSEGATLEALKMSRRFGLGLSAGGPLSVLGMEVDINVREDISVSLGLGTGLDYSSFMVKARYYLLGEWVSPYLGMALARWWTSGTTSTTVTPSVLTSRFLPGGYDYTQGFSVFFMAPAIGVQFMHPMGFAVSIELQYFFKLVDFANGTFAGIAAHWYF
jgi:hypothetical protein